MLEAFTANSMNCLTEALGLSLPGNGSTLQRIPNQALFLEAVNASLILRVAVMNKMMPAPCPATSPHRGLRKCDGAGYCDGRINEPVLHLLAASYEGEVGFTMEDIDRLSRKVPCLSKVAPAKSDVHMEDVHRAGGIMAILGELDRAGLIHRDTKTVHSPTMGDALELGCRAQATPKG